MKALHCDMTRDCVFSVTHIDNRGYVYCDRCAILRKAGGTPIRKLRPGEIKKLELGGTIRYARKN